ncbi:myosin-IIIb-like [Saccoglossus kowalevskii]|uniref:non-specific serine/threonine protein kinase n=1 Tax=Saccoglossus kowalevskii TaxID=10224 RepID=A0ABM0MGE4_SACKO|nr:PREDICTED: myosin-IIIb-like [Saccoglossus kowalevskii]
MENLLGLDQQSLEGVLTHSEHVTKGELVVRNYTKDVAQDCCDAISKALYGRLFGWIVNKINQLLAPAEEISINETKEIGILDIFGFEHFQKNSFEQACINLANEQLQFFFNQHIFMMEQEEYQSEGIDWTNIPFVNNQPLLDLFLGKPIGILTLLDEECQFPQASDHTFVEKMNHNFAGNHFYIKSRVASNNIFSIDHYAARVEYDAQGFLEKNRDTLPNGVIQLLKESKNALLNQIFRGTITRTGTLALQMRTSRGFSRKKRFMQPPPKASRKNLTLGGQFKNSLNVLMERMAVCNPHFVRCIKPNTAKAANKFEDQFVLVQLRYCGMLETTRIRKQGYAIRPSFTEFVSIYKILALHPKIPEDKNGCLRILKAAGITNWQIGKNKVFLKYYHGDELLAKLEQFDKAAVHVQRVVRGFLARRKYLRMKEEARKRAIEVNNFLKQLENLNIDSYDKQQMLIKKDRKIPKDYFKKLKKAESMPADLPAPPLPAHAKSNSKSAYKDLELPVPPNEYTDPTDEGDDENDTDDDILEDEFVRTKKNMGFGPEGSKEASILWFKSTQSEKLKETHGFSNWFHGIITRRQAEKLLWDKQIGCYLIRVSESRFGYSLSFRVKERCKHFMIDQTRSGKYVVVGEPRVHASLSALVKYHEKTPISPFGDLLTVPCGQVEGESDYAELISDASIKIRQMPPLRPPPPSVSRQPQTSNAARIYPDLTAISNQSSTPPLPERNYSPQSNRKHRKGPAPQPPSAASRQSQASQASYLSLIKDQQDMKDFPKTGEVKGKKKR